MLPGEVGELVEETMATTTALTLVLKSVERTVSVLKAQKVVATEKLVKMLTWLNTLVHAGALVGLEH